MKRLAKVSGLAWAAVALAGLACTGQVADGSGPGAGPGSPGDKGGGMGPGGGGAPPTPVPPVITPGPDGVVDSAGPHGLRRLTVLEYANTVRDLLGVTLSDSDRRGFSADQVVEGGFASGAAITTSVDSRQFLDVSSKVAAAATADLAKLLPAGCATPAPAAEKGCIDKFLSQFAPRAFRRPLTTEETTGFAELFAKVRGAEASYGEAVHDLLLAILQSPEFLYRWERVGQPIKDGALVRFGDYEIASRLSYFLWSSMPDEDLFKAAAAGALQRPDQIAAQAERMLKDRKASDGLRDFHLQWLGIYGFDEVEKGDIYKTYTPEVAKAMLAETSAFVDAILFGPNATGKLEDLLTSRTSYVNGPLAAHYGVSGISGEALQKVELPNRAGILTQGSFLTKHSKEVESFPIIRGVYVLRNVLCQDIPEPQIELPPAPEQKQGQTTRQLYEDFTSAAACQACHSRINAVGFALENYDATGRYRTNEEGQPVDSSGVLELPSGKVAFKNGIEFLQAIAKTPEARECVARNWMRALLRREERPDEGGSLKAVRGAFETSGYDLRSLLVELTKTRAFTHHNPSAAGK